MVEGLYPYDPKYGQIIQSDVPGVNPDRAFLSHLVYENPAAADDDGIAVINLGGEAKTVTTGIENPDVPRCLSVGGSVAGISGEVVITGKNYAGETITETLTVNGTTADATEKAFASIDSIAVPQQVNTPAQQTETITISSGCSQDGDLTVTITAAALGDDSPASVTVPVTTALNDVTKVAEAIVAALNADDTVSAAFTASNEAGVITLTANEPADNDTSLAIAINAGSTGVTAGSSTNGTSGAPYDQIKVGFIDVLGMPYCLAHNTVLAAYLNNVLESTAPTVTTSATAVESNTIDLNSALNGKQVDVYLIV